MGIRWLLVSAMVASLVSCQLGIRDIPTVENAVTYGGVKYPIQKSVFWPQDGSYFFIDLAQSGIVTDPVATEPDPTLSHGFWMELRLYSDPAAPATSGSFLASDETLSNVAVATYASGEESRLFDDLADSGGVKVTLTGSKLSIHGSLLGSYYVNDQLTSVLIQLDYEGPYETGVWP